MIGELINNYGEVSALAILVGAMVWYLKYQTKRQATREDNQDVERKEERVFYRDLITNDLKELHKDNSKNADLNNQSLVLQKDMIKSQGKLVSLIESVDKRINGRSK